VRHVRPDVHIVHSARLADVKRNLPSEENARNVTYVYAIALNTSSPEIKVDQSNSTDATHEQTGHTNALTTQIDAQNITVSENALNNVHKNETKGDIDSNPPPLQHSKSNETTEEADTSLLVRPPDHTESHETLTDAQSITLSQDESKYVQKNETKEEEEDEEYEDYIGCPTAACLVGGPG